MHELVLILIKLQFWLFISNTKMKKHKEKKKKKCPWLLSFLGDDDSYSNQHFTIDEIGCFSFVGDKIE